jgi:hypothetical protein
MSNIIDIQQFLVGKTFHIPTYQRDYAWTTAQVDDLFEDIQEALDTQSGHYLGTLVLANNGGNNYEVVDGQQRLTTLTLVIHALLQELANDDPDRIADTAILVMQGRNLKLDCGNNRTFVENLFSGGNPSPASAGQRKLEASYSFARDRAKALKSSGGDNLVKQWIACIKTLEIIQFVATDTGRAIRMFQTVNDRGLPLTAMDKAKALLVFYSNRCLGGALDQMINSCFGQCFADYDALREFAKQPAFRVTNIARDNFSEDDILRYHYLAYTHPDAVNAADYEGSLRTVFDAFLKGTLKTLARDPEKLTSFIKDYVTDLSAFAAAFKTLVLACETDRRLYKLFVILGLAARLYPLTVRLHQRSILTATLPNHAQDLLYCIEVCDVRVYKTRGTDPAKDIGDLSHRSRSISISDAADALRAFAQWFMPDGNFQTSLGQVMDNNGAVLLMLLAYDEEVAQSAYTIKKLADLVSSQITREHIIAQVPNFSVTAHGFADDEDFKTHLPQVGNLTLLTKGENSRCNNLAVHTKMTDPALYTASVFAGPRHIAHYYASNGCVFNKTEVIQRTGYLSNWILKKWAIW